MLGEGAPSCFAPLRAGDPDGRAKTSAPATTGRPVLMLWAATLQAKFNLEAFETR